MSLTVFALTAGLGTRLRPYTTERAKPTLPFLGVPMALHSLRHIENLPVTKLYMNLHHAPESIRKLPLGPLKVPPPQYSDESAQILGSGGALAQVIRHIQTPNILLMNGDEVYLPQNPHAMEDAYKDHQQSGRLATLVTMPHPEVGKSLGGAWTDSKNRVVCFSKTPVSGLTGHHYVGYLFLSSRIEKYFKLPIQEENILYETLTHAMAAGEEVSCHSEEAYWFETGRTELFIESTQEVLQLLRTQKKDPAVRDLFHFLIRFSEFEFVVEKEDRALCQQIEDIHKMSFE